MDRSAALVRLGLNGGEDAAGVTHAYAQRLTDVQEKLVSAQTDAERSQHQASLSTLVEAYESLTQTGRFTPAPPAEISGGTVARPPASTVLSSPSAPATAQVRMQTGEVLASRLEIGVLLGQGGMGYVYAARDRLRDEDVAIKVLRQDLIFSVAARERFLAEARVSSNLSHPNIVRVYDVGEAGGHYYLSMERLKGQTLRQRIESFSNESRACSVAEVTDIARQLIDALRYAHRYIVHRDIKPENIWIADDGTVKLMDFGIARAYSSSHMTQTGMTLGTAYYMAPEQRLDAKEVDWRADQYALGVVMYELLSGSIPMGAVKPIDQVRRDLPPRYAHAVMRAMAPRPEDRWPSLDALLAEIQAPQSSSGSVLRWLVLAGCTAAVAAAGVYYGGLLNRGPAPTERAAATPPAIAASPTTSASGTQPPPQDPPPPEQNIQTAAVEPEQTPPQTQTAAPPDEIAPAVSAAPAAMVPVVAKASSQPVKTAAVDTGANRRQECIAQCERDDGECRSFSRRGKQECMRGVGFGATNGFTPVPQNQYSTQCAFYGVERCRYATDRSTCEARMGTRYNECMTVYDGSNIASRHQDCENSARKADALCLDQLRDCRSYCQ